MRLEPLEERQMLSVSSFEFSQLQDQYPELNITEARYESTTVGFDASTLTASDLQQAIIDAANGAGDDLIVIRTTSEFNTLVGNFDIPTNADGSITIVALGSDNFTLDGDAAARVMTVNSGSEAEFGGINFTNGLAVSVSGGLNGDGGGIYVADNAVVTVVNGEISQNSVNRTNLGGAIFGQDWRGGHGGGVFIATTGEFTAYNSSIYDNSTNYRGGGIFVDGTLNLYNSEVYYNDATTSTQNTFSTSNGDGIYAQSGSHVTLTNVTVAHNNNDTGVGGKAGSGIYSLSDNFNLTNSIVAYNGSGTFVTNGADASGTFVITNSLVRRLTGTSTQTDSLVGTQYDPSFVGEGDYRLNAGSVAIDAGNTNAFGGQFDLAGSLRVTDGNNDSIATIDIGAYEYQATTAEAALAVALGVSDDEFYAGESTTVSWTLSNTGTAAFTGDWTVLFEIYNGSELIRSQEFSGSGLNNGVTGDAFVITTNLGEQGNYTVKAYVNDDYSDEVTFTVLQPALTVVSGSAQVDEGGSATFEIAWTGPGTLTADQIAVDKADSRLTVEVEAGSEAGKFLVTVSAAQDAIYGNTSSDTVTFSTANYASTQVTVIINDATTLGVLALDKESEIPTGALASESVAVDFDLIASGDVAINSWTGTVSLLDGEGVVVTSVEVDVDDLNGTATLLIPLATTAGEYTLKIDVEYNDGDDDILATIYEGAFTVTQPALVIATADEESVREGDTIELTVMWNGTPTADAPITVEFFEMDDNGEYTVNVTADYAFDANSVKFSGSDVSFNVTVPTDQILDNDRVVKVVVSADHYVSHGTTLDVADATAPATFVLSDIVVDETSVIAGCGITGSGTLSNTGDVSTGDDWSVNVWLADASGVKIDGVLLLSSEGVDGPPGDYSYDNVALTIPFGTAAGTYTVYVEIVNGDDGVLASLASNTFTVTQPALMLDPEVSIEVSEDGTATFTIIRTGDTALNASDIVTAVTDANGGENRLEVLSIVEGEAGQYTVTVRATQDGIYGNTNEDATIWFTSNGYISCTVFLTVLDATAPATFVLSDITVNETTVIAGCEITGSGSVENIGDVPSDANWSVNVWLVDDSGEKVGDSPLRTEAGVVGNPGIVYPFNDVVLEIPFGTEAGTYTILVEIVNGDDEVLASAYSNTFAVTQPALTSVTSIYVDEGSSTEFFVSFTGDVAPENISCSSDNDDVTYAITPGEGDYAGQIKVTVTAPRNAVVEENGGYTANLTFSAEGYADCTVAVYVADDTFTNLAISNLEGPAVVYPGQEVTYSVEIANTGDTAINGGWTFVVTLTADNNEVLTYSQTFEDDIPAGAVISYPYTLAVPADVIDFTTGTFTIELKIDGVTDDNDETDNALTLADVAVGPVFVNISNPVEADLSNKVEVTFSEDLANFTSDAITITQDGTPIAVEVTIVSLENGKYEITWDKTETQNAGNYVLSIDGENLVDLHGNPLLLPEDGIAVAWTVVANDFSGVQDDNCVMNLNKDFGDDADSFSFVLDVLVNDGTNLPESVSIVIVNQGYLGTAVANEDGTVTFIWNETAFGEGTFTYKLVDNSNDENVSAEVTVSFAIGYFVSDEDQTFADLLVSEKDDIEDYNLTSGDGLSIREALWLAGLHTGTDTITFTESLAGEKIDLVTETELSVNSGVNIFNTTEGTITIDANDASRIFNVAAGTTVVISNLALTNGYTSARGGAVYSEGYLTLNNIDVSDSYAESHGGGVLQKHGTITINGGMYTGNESRYGGGVSLENVSNATINNVDFSDNTALSKGGALHQDRGNLVVTGGNIVDNAANYYGGGFFQYAGGTATFDGTMFSNCSAELSGAGIYSQANLELIDVVVENCIVDAPGVAGTYGGGLYHKDGTLAITGGRFENNEAAWGGAVWTSNATGVVTITDVEFVSNTAYSGAGVYNSSCEMIITGGSFVDNTTSRSGAFYQAKGGQTTIEGTTFLRNETANKGGAIYFFGSLTLTDVVFMDCSAAVQGGAIHQNGGELTLTRGTFINNASVYGGAISLIWDEGSTIMGSSFVDNFAGSGGAIYVTESTAGGLSIIDSQFSGNSAVYGGAITLENALDVMISYIRFNTNTASAKGGAIYQTGGSTSVRNSTFADNSARLSGGAINLYSGELAIELLDDLPEDTFTGNTVLNGNGTGITKESLGKLTVGETVYDFGLTEYLEDDDISNW